MAKSKPSTRILNKVLERATSPVYVVSSDFVIAYANDACARWVGLDLESLVSATCVFTSQDLTEVQNKVQGLCPPPEAMSPTGHGEPSPHFFSAWAYDGDNQKSWRTGTMSTLLDADQNHLGILVVCDAQTITSAPLINATTPIVEPDKLHRALAEIRTQTDRIYSLESLVGTSSFANRMRRQVSTAIETNADLLIVGPQGSGKEHLSRTIHSARDQSAKSELLPVHCSIADQQLIQQNIKDIVGSRHTSDNGEGRDEQDWLLLLDVDRLGEAAQNELLGFFQLPNLPLRTIATSSVSLIELATRQQYSADLAHHLSVMTIDLVALAKRQSDIPVLAQALIERDNFRRDRQLSGFSDGVMQLFIEFDWPENIDQLNRTIQVAASNTSGPWVDETDLPDEFRQGLLAMRVGTADEMKIELDQFMGEVEKELIIRALNQAKGNKTKAAKLLGINRPKLLRRLQFFGLGILEVNPMDNGDGELDASAFEELE